MDPGHARTPGLRGLLVTGQTLSGQPVSGHHISDTRVSQPDHRFRVEQCLGIVRSSMACFETVYLRVKFICETNKKLHILYVTNLSRPPQAISPSTSYLALLSYLLSYTVSHSWHVRITVLFISSRHHVHRRGIIDPGLHHRMSYKTYMSYIDMYFLLPCNGKFALALCIHQGFRDMFEYSILNLGG
jgi:hypothetical protein